MGINECIVIFNIHIPIWLLSVLSISIYAHITGFVWVLRGVVRENHDPYELISAFKRMRSHFLGSTLFSFIVTEHFIFQGLCYFSRS